jgi:tetratricopeptide (TPR) repeat protein
MRITCTLVLAVALLSTLAAQTNDSGIRKDIVEAKTLIQKAMNSGDQEFFARAEDRLGPARNDSHFAALANYYVGYASYKRSMILLQVDKDKAVAYLDTAVSRLEEAVSRDRTFAEAYALLSSCLGMKISFAPAEAMALGPKSSSALARAKELAPTNPRVAMVGALATYNTPPMYGGSKERGFEEMKSAVGLFDHWGVTDSLQPDWGKDEIWAWIGIAHMQRKEMIQAKRALDRSLEINPDNGWVKHVLLPKLAAQAESK